MAIATNAVTLSNSFMIANLAMKEADHGDGFTLATAGTAFAPYLTYLNWTESDNPSYKLGLTPIAYMADTARRYAPPSVNGLLCANFTIVGAPGAFAGHFGGSVVGAFTPSQGKKTPEFAPR